LTTACGESTAADVLSDEGAAGAPSQFAIPPHPPARYAVTVGGSKPVDAAKLFVGPSGWSYSDWEGIVYPKPAPRGFHPLAYLARFFCAVEVNTSFYRPPTPRMTAAWVRRVEHIERFLFAFKLFQRFTHHREPYGPPEVQAFREGLRPVAEAGRLGCVLAQFPWSFRRGAEGFDWLARLAEDFAEFPLIVEVRHDSWDHDEVREQFRQMRLGWCNIDQPRLAHCLGPTSHVTGDIAYVRLHGRRRYTWFADGVPASERYNYLYAPEALREWADRVRELGERAARVFVFANNHHAGQGPANAIELRALLEGGPVPAPATLREHFAALSGMTIVPKEMGLPPTLFDA